jgi:hypothetical protein
LPSRSLLKMTVPAIGGATALAAVPVEQMRRNTRSDNETIIRR